MNFDELKSKWENESNDDVNIPQNMEKLKMAQHPIENLKRNMRNELYAQVAAIIFLGLVPYLYDLHNSLYILYYIAYAMLLVISIYYLNSFYRFYKGMHQYSAATKDGLLELYYELRLNMERYKSFGFLLLPFGIIWVGLYLYNNLLDKGVKIESLSNKTLLIGTICIVAMTSMMMLAINWWVNSFYGKYTKRVRQILDELREE